MALLSPKSLRLVRLPVDRISVIRPAERAAQAEAAPERLILADDPDPGDIHVRAVEKAAIEIGDAVKLGAIDCSAGVLPVAVVIGRDAEAAGQAVGIVERDDGAVALVKRSKCTDE